TGFALRLTATILAGAPPRTHQPAPATARSRRTKRIRRCCPLPCAEPTTSSSPCLRARRRHHEQWPSRRWWLSTGTRWTRAWDLAPLLPRQWPTPEVPSKWLTTLERAPASASVTAPLASEWALDLFLHVWDLALPSLDEWQL